MAENGNSTETPVDVVATGAPDETPAASAKGKGKAVASDVQEDVAMDDDDDDDEDEDEVSISSIYALRAILSYDVTLY